MRSLLIAAAVTTLIAPAAVEARTHHRVNAPLPPVRRIVTSQDAAGRSYVLADGSSANVVMLNGSRVERLWETQGLPVAIPVDRDLGATAKNGYRPGFVGSSMYVADIPVGSGLQQVPMHKLNSMDYIVVMEGMIDLVLDGDKRVPMKRGDILIQAGDNHSWINTGNTPVRLLNIIMTGQRVVPQTTTPSSPGSASPAPQSPG